MSYGKEKERARREKERIKRKASAPHTKARNLKARRPPTTKKNTESPVFAVFLRMLPYIYRT
jgi:hypothetical protein